MARISDVQRRLIVDLCLKEAPRELCSANIGKRCGVVCSTPSRQESEGMLPGGKSESTTRHTRGVSNGTCCAALRVQDGHRWRVVANRVYDSTFEIM